MGTGPGSDVRRFIAVDPGVNHHAISWWRLMTDNSIRSSWELESASLVQRTDLRMHLCAGGAFDLVVIERMHVYPTGSTGRKGDQNDLIAVSEASGELVGIARYPAGYYVGGPLVRALWLTERQWKGGMPKKICHHYVQAALSPTETSRVCLPSVKAHHHNVWDSVGIGLRCANRAPWG